MQGTIEVGYQVFVADGGEEVGAVRQVAPDGQPELVVFTYGEVSGLNPRTGNLEWSVPHASEQGVNVATPVWGPGNLLFVSSAYNGGSRVLRLSRSDGQVSVAEVWANRRVRIHFGNAVRDGNRRVIGVVMGGATARSRDALMASLLDRNVPKASPVSTSRLVASIGNIRTKQVEVASASDNVAVDIDAQTTATTRKRLEVAPVAPLAYAATSNVTVPMDRPVAMDEIMSAGKPAATGGWQVQIAATPSAQAAKDILSEAKSRTGNALANASPYTEAFGKGGNTVYRARFVGFSTRDDASSACAALKRKDFDCMLLPNKG